MCQLTMRFVFTSMLVTACLAIAKPAGAELVDRVLALVAGQTILLSDVRAFVRLGLVHSTDTGEQQSDTLGHLIRRHLILTEVDRYLVEEPAAKIVDQRLGQVRKQFQTEGQWSDVLAETGLNNADLRHIVRDEIRIETYLDQRFISAIQPTDDELLNYYRQHQDDFTNRGTPLPFAEVQGTVRSQLAAERRQDLISEWVSSLRDRGNIIRLGQPFRE